MTFRSYQIVDDYRKEVSEKCQKEFKSWFKGRDETYARRLGLALLKAYKLNLMIKNASGMYTSVLDRDVWKFGSHESRSSVTKFHPQFIIAPGRMVRMMVMTSKIGAETRIDMAMGVPMEFLTTEMWFCTSCCRNTLFVQVLKDVQNLPILSNMMIIERICLALEVCPVPLVKVGGPVTPTTSKDFLRPMKWMYDRPAEQLQKYAHNYRSDIPLRASEAVISTDTIVPALKLTTTP